MFRKFKFIINKPSDNISYEYDYTKRINLKKLRKEIVGCTVEDATKKLKSRKYGDNITINIVKMGCHLRCFHYQNRIKFIIDHNIDTDKATIIDVLAG